MLVCVCRRRPREPAPGWKKHYHSYVFGRKMRVRVTNSAKRTIADAGGFDRYIYYTPEEDFKSKLGVVLQRRMRFLVERHPNVAPPPLDKRNPKPVSKKISAGLPPVEVANMSKYLFLA